MSRTTKTTRTPSASTISKQGEQRDREAERQSYRESEKSRLRETYDTHATDEKRPSASVRTLQDAVVAAHNDKSPGDRVFKFARALKAFEKHNGQRIPPNELEGAFNMFWSMNLENRPADDDRDE